MGEIIAVLSGKGGTGKTSLCAGIASALAQEGLRVLCIDCDVGLRNLDISLGLDNFAAVSFSDVLCGNYSLDQLPHHPAFSNLWFLTAPMNVSVDQIDAASFSAMVRQARDMYDFVFLDAPAGVDAGFRLAATDADRILLVTGADPASIRDAGRTGEVLELMGKGSIRMVVNRVNPKLVSTMARTIDDVIDEAGIQLIGIVPEDSNIILAAAFGKPLLLQSRKGAASRACRRIAKRLQGRPVRIEL
jgi:septum site-determining protein MinD